MTGWYQECGAYRADLSEYLSVMLWEEPKGSGDTYRYVVTGLESSSRGRVQGDPVAIQMAFVTLAKKLKDPSHVKEALKEFERFWKGVYL